MILDSIMNIATGAISGLMDNLPDWQTSLDVSQVRNLIQSMQAWNNWLALDQLCICIGISVGLWVAKQTLGLAIKGFELLKP